MTYQELKNFIIGAGFTEQKFTQAYKSFDFEPSQEQIFSYLLNQTDSKDGQDQPRITNSFYPIQNSENPKNEDIHFPQNYQMSPNSDRFKAGDQKNRNKKINKKKGKKNIRKRAIP